MVKHANYGKRLVNYRKPHWQATGLLQEIISHNFSHHENQYAHVGLSLLLTVLDVPADLPKSNHDNTPIILSFTVIVPVKRRCLF